MFVCTGPAPHIWGTRISSCHQLGCGAPLRPLGDDDADFDHPAISRFPLRRVMRRGQIGEPAPKLRRRFRRKPPAEPVTEVA